MSMNSEILLLFLYVGTTNIISYMISLMAFSNLRTFVSIELDIEFYIFLIFYPAPRLLGKYKIMIIFNNVLCISIYCFNLNIFH